MATKPIHFEHCPGCSDPLCKVIADATVTGKKSGVTCSACKRALNTKKATDSEDTELERLRARVRYLEDRIISLIPKE